MQGTNVLANKQHNGTLDVLKVFGSIAVVMIHVFFIQEVDGWYRPLLDLAVPLYFTITGYYIFKRDDEYLDKYIKKIFKMYFIYVIVYTISNFLLHIFNAQGPHITIDPWEYTQVNHYLITILSGTIGKYHLWYLWALAWGVVILKEVRKLKLPPWILLLLFVIIQQLNILIPINYIQNGGLPKALVYLTLGYCIHVYSKKGSKLVQISLAMVLVYYIILYLVIPYNVVLLNIYELITLGVVTIIMYLATTNPTEPNRVISKLSHYVLPVYVLHLMVLEWVTFFGGNQGWEMGEMTRLIVYTTLGVVIPVVWTVVKDVVKTKYTKQNYHKVNFYEIKG